MGAATANAGDDSSNARAQVRGMQIAGLFGESDDEKAARQQHEDNQDAQIADLKQQIHDLEQTLQQLTGQNEQLSHHVHELSDKIDSQQKDYDYKLCALSAQMLGVSAAPDQSGSGLPCNLSGAQATQAAPLPNSGGVLGTLPQGAVADTKPQFDSAMNLLAKAQYDEARAAFRAFADNNPKDPLAPQAVYWVGDIAFVQKDYTGAAQAFVEEIKKYPTSSRGPDSMLKLGQSLLALGQKKEGCVTLGAIKSKYPQASSAVLSQAASIRTSSCK
jgi:tol-pal system protein YbgF